MDLADAFCAPQLLAAAGRLDETAGELRGWSARLGAAAADRRWDGDGARAFRSRAHEVVSRLHGAAATLETAAAALRRHAATVADRQAARAAHQREVARELLESVGVRP